VDAENPPVPAEQLTCAECGTRIDEGQDREVTDDGVFCRPCFNNLTAQL
jgi:formylmethanofuran dehydrogenase subunit E